MADLHHEREIIKKFVVFYNKQNQSKFLIETYPEDHNETPVSMRIEALYKDNNNKLAIEHTSLDGYVDQRKNEKQLVNALGPLRDELKDKLPLQGYYSLTVSKDCNMPKGINWVDFRNAVSDSIIKNANALELPKICRLTSLKIRLDNIPFEFTLSRHNMGDSCKGVFYISKFAHESDDLDKQKEIIIEKALQKKIQNYYLMLA